MKCSTLRDLVRRASQRLINQDLVARGLRRHEAIRSNVPLNCSRMVQKGFAERPVSPQPRSAIQTIPTVDPERGAGPSPASVSSRRIGLQWPPPYPPPLSLPLRARHGGQPNLERSKPVCNSGPITALTDAGERDVPQRHRCQALSHSATRPGKPTGFHSVGSINQVFPVCSA